MTHLLLFASSPLYPFIHFPPSSFTPSLCPFTPPPFFLYLSTLFYFLTFLNLSCPFKLSFLSCQSCPPFFPNLTPLVSAVVFPLRLTKLIRLWTVVWNDTKYSSRLIRLTTSPHFVERLIHRSADHGWKADIASFVEYGQIIALFCINFDFSVVHNNWFSCSKFSLHSFMTAPRKCLQLLFLPASDGYTSF